MDCNLHFQSTRGIIANADLHGLNTSAELTACSPPTRQSSISFHFVQFLYQFSNVFWKEEAQIRSISSAASVYDFV